LESTNIYTASNFRHSRTNNMVNDHSWAYDAISNSVKKMLSLILIASNVLSKNVTLM
jgi:hypothetical protein